MGLCVCVDFQKVELVSCTDEGNIFVSFHYLEIPFY
jgi:hypothetical protein